MCLFVFFGGWDGVRGPVKLCCWADVHGLSTSEQSAGSAHLSVCLSGQQRLLLGALRGISEVASR